jgi:hypothetical protein
MQHVRLLLVQQPGLVVPLVRVRPPHLAASFNWGATAIPSRSPGRKCHNSTGGLLRHPI